ncbi:MAG: DUF222 domain-containing protein [Gordonia sp. (in: high G+C Gram-positive bacteria)]|uniref:HNH endonuclease signature motif containing protein n=1 Tax=Gordonia sp. (in: high G+C Gram-positive bacteria) TaxID=84139 RepID=UPI003C70FF4E
MTTRTSTRPPASTVEVSDGEILIRIARPAPVASGGSAEGSAASSGVVRDSRAQRLAFAARVDSFAGVVMWHRYSEICSLLQERFAEAQADTTSDVFARVYDPLCQVAASYATAAGVRQYTAEQFVERAVACVERIPAVGGLLRDGLIPDAWFARVVEQTALVDDLALLALIDAEVAHRLMGLGGLSAKRVEAVVAAVVAEHDPDAVTLTREQVKAYKKVLVNPLSEGMSELIITAAAEDVRIAKEVLDAVIAGVCPKDPRTKQVRRSDAAMARLNGTAFTCQCGEDDCTAELSAEQVQARCARVVLHVVVREETLDGTSETPAQLDGFGPISAQHVHEIAARSDAVARKVDLGDLLDHQAQPGNNYRPTATLDVVLRGLFGTCTWPGCSEPAFAADLDHVCEYDHDDPAAGGPTCLCNINPKCRFHHGLKTSAEGWLDDQIVDANGVIWTEVTTPEGFTVRQQALNTWLLPEVGLIPCSHPTFGGTRPDSGHVEDGPQRTKSRTKAKHDYRIARRAANRRIREEAEARELAEDGVPPF